MNLLETYASIIISESVLLGLLLFLTLFGFPGWIKIAIAKIKGCQYVIRLTRDNTLIFEGAREREGMYKTSHGVYELEPEDSFSFNGSSGAIWYSPYNRAVAARVMPLLTDLKKAGIETYSQLMYYYKTPIEKIQAEAGEEIAEIARVIQGYEGKILQDLEVVRISDLKNFLESRSPAAENGIIERYVDIERRKLGNPLKNSNFIMMLVMVGLLGLCFGFILAGGSGAEIPGATAAGSAAGTLTQLS